MSQPNGAYPSRLKESEDRIDPFIRTDPVIRSGNEYRWHGPLDEVALSKYERDGFLWFEGFFNQERSPMPPTRNGPASWGAGKTLPP